MYVTVLLVVCSLVYFFLLQYFTLGSEDLQCSGVVVRTVYSKQYATKYLAFLAKHIIINPKFAIHNRVRPCSLRVLAHSAPKQGGAIYLEERNITQVLSGSWTGSEFMSNLFDFDDVLGAWSKFKKIYLSMFDKVVPSKKSTSNKELKVGSMLKYLT